jgi:aminoglycoside phosphotransferase (APT) family kinase protein
MSVPAIPREDALRGWLAARLDADPAALAIAPLAESGDSNLMFTVAGEGGRWVLRCPPSVKNDRTAHDVLREYRMLEALERTDVPHPRPVVACEDADVLGAPFYVMEHVDGFSPSDPLPGRWADDHEALRGIGPAAAEALAALAEAPWREIGLEGFGRPEGFLERQVPRWLRQLEGYRSRELPGLDEVARWLEEHRPPDQPPAILHGDFHLRNVMFGPEPPARVAAIVDWEMATIGDPLLDLGALLATWSEPGEEVFMNGAVTDRPGMATRTEIAAAYERRSSRSLEHVDYYMALALFKLACILEGSYSRLLAGDSEHAGHRSYETLVPIMVHRAHAITRGAWSL